LLLLSLIYIEIENKKRRSLHPKQCVT